MGNVVFDAVKEAFDLIESDAGVEAVYFSRGGQAVPCKVVFGRSQGEFVSVYEQIAAVAPGTDFLVRGSSIQDEPKKGCYFVIGTTKYDVTERNDGFWRWSDSFRYVRRIHVTEVVS